MSDYNLSTSNFIHLHLHSSYSLLEGAITTENLTVLCSQNNMPAVAITDTGNLFAALELSELLSKKGIQPIIGCQIDLMYYEDTENFKPRPIVLLAKNKVGYQNLIKLSTIGYLDRDESNPYIEFNDLELYGEGLICLSGGALGPLGEIVLRSTSGSIDKLTNRFLKIFGNRFYIELQRHPTQGELRTIDEGITEPKFLQLALTKNIPIVATNDVYFPDEGMYEAHDALLCISSGSYIDQKAPRRRLTDQHYFKSSEEMKELFSDLPEAILNTVEIAQRCAVKAECREPILPKFASNEVDELNKQAVAGLEKRLKSISHATSAEKYFERLNFELSVIKDMGFPGYFLIVADFIKWAKVQGIPVGPGRGSGAGSLVAYALTITDLDPIRYSLLFERFLNPERVSMPDFDIDFCMDRREEVINYVQEKYGKEKVAQIITFGALLSKAAIRDIGRVLQIPYGHVDKLSKMIPLEATRPVSIAQALKDEPKLLEEKNNSEVVARMLDYAEKIEGLLRNASTHAAGVVIADRPLDELVPLYRDPRSDMQATQFNMKWVEQAGLVKFDFLGLKTLTIVKNAIDLLQKRGVDIDINSISLNDVKTFNLYARAKTIAVFQVESSGMRDALTQLRPTCIEDIIALVALYRPGPMENIPKFCAVKNGEQERESIHPLIDGILDETQGIIVYQEQVMEIARKMGGYSLGGADLLRRAMGKKIKAAMDAEKPNFLAGSLANNVNKKTATKVWDLLEKFANYGFNKSHAAAYAVLSYQTAWLKANYPIEFMAAVMNCDIHLTEKLTVYKQELENLGLKLNSPCINMSTAYFSVFEGQIFYALGALKNVGIGAVEQIVDTRVIKGPFIDIFDFARRIDLRKVGKRPLEMLIRSGAFDCLNKNRKLLFESIEQLVSFSAAMFDESLSGQRNLFGTVTESVPKPRFELTEDWMFTEKLSQECQAVGFYLSGHPIDEYLSYLFENNVMIFSKLKKDPKEIPSLVNIVGVVSGKQERQSARGNRFAFVQFSDPGGIFEVTVFSDVLARSREMFDVGAILVLLCEVKTEGEQIKLLLKGANPIKKIVEKADSSGFRVFVESVEAVNALAMRLRDDSSKTDVMAVPLNVVVINTGLAGDIEIELPDNYLISPDLIGAIKHIEGVTHLERIKS
ncbi:MAG: DNA polymerase III subunit alpha [Paracoccaceae bacterium]|nr:DNA polymerase III subunit alpha [Paracoccaceae bacterium]